jgi:hypothetical protein
MPTNAPLLSENVAKLPAKRSVRYSLAKTAVVGWFGAGFQMIENQIQTWKETRNAPVRASKRSMIWKKTWKILRKGEEG